MSGFREPADGKQRFDPVRRLIYVSRSTIDADGTLLELIVRQSSACNASAGITGMLWFDGANFVQVLEGEADRVDEAFARIKCDPRHTDLEVVIDREVRSRAFGRWSMTQPDDGPESMAATAFLVGLSLSQAGAAARRLHDIMVACDI